MIEQVDEIGEFLNLEERRDRVDVTAPQIERDLIGDDVEFAPVFESGVIETPLIEGRGVLGFGLGHFRTPERVAAATFYLLGVTRDQRTEVSTRHHADGSAKENRG